MASLRVSTAATGLYWSFRYKHTILLRSNAAQHRIGMTRRTPHPLSLYGALTRKGAGVLAEVRTCHTYLRQYLARVHRVDRAVCEYGDGVESVRSVLHYGPLWAPQREHSKKAARVRWGDLSFLLGCRRSRKGPRTEDLIEGDK